MCLVVNFFAGAGAGKSTLSSAVFSELKWRGVNCELALEFAKDLVWEDRLETLDNQLYVSGKQLQRIERLIDKVDVIITDSPILLSLIYKPKYYPESFNSLMLDLFNGYKNLNFYVNRVKPYEQRGRVQTEEESRQIDSTVEYMLKNNNINYIKVDGKRENIDYIVEEIMKKIAENVPSITIKGD